jgi:hypothetical protein
MENTMEKVLKFALKEAVKKIKNLDEYAKTQAEGYANLADFCKELAETFGIKVSAEIIDGFVCFSFVWAIYTVKVDLYLEPCWRTKPNTEVF